MNMGNIYLFAVLNAIILFAKINNVNAQGFFSIFSSGRLLTPEEGCGISKVTNTKIVGGTEPKPGAYPWMALVVRTRLNEDGIPKKKIVCGGSLITSRHVLTAANCLIPDVSHVRLGEHDIKDSTRQEIRVIKYVGHHNYSDSHKLYNIAVLTLEFDVDFDDHVRPICLPLSKIHQSGSFVDFNPFVAGWGRTAEEASWSKVLQVVQLPVLENKLCEDLYTKVGQRFGDHQFSNLVLCAGNLAGGQGSCIGDTGGPLMLPILDKGEFPMYQIGIVAYSFGCARPDVPTVFTRVSEFIDWIQEQVMSS